MLNITAEQLQGYTAKLKASVVPAPGDELVTHSLALLGYVAQELRDIEALCTYSCKWAKDFSEIIAGGDVNQGSIERVFMQLVLVVREQTITTGLIDHRVIPVFDYVDRIYAAQPQQYKFYEFYKYSIYKNVVANQYATFDGIRRDVEHRQNELQAKLNESIVVVENLQQQLDSQHRQYNFVGLSAAFNNLLVEKKKSKLWLTIAIISLATVVLAVPIVVPWIAAKWFDYVQVFGAPVDIKDLPGRFFAAMPFVAVEGVLIYLFRILLGNYYNLKSQITQLELRYGICQFVEGYLDFRGKFDPSCASRFEALIFGDLDRQNANTPNPFDFDSIAKIVEALKK